MAIFAIIGHVKLDTLKSSVEQNYPGQHFALAPATWFVADSVTSSEVSAKIGLPEGKLGAHAVVIPVTAYAGYAPADLWEWLKSRWEN